MVIAMETSKNDIILHVKDLKMYYPLFAGMFRKKVGVVKAVDGVNLFVHRGETLGLVGESGCGKTSLGKCLVRLQKPTAGNISFFGQGIDSGDILTLDRNESFALRKKIQIVFQDPYSALNPTKTIQEMFEEPMRLHGIGSAAERVQIIRELLTAVNLRPEYMRRYPHEFSGGQRQRICIARALCVNPEIVVLDEPVSALDVSIQAQVLNLLKDLQQERSLTYIFIAHDLSVVEYMSDRVAVMYLGNIVELAAGQKLYHECLHPYTEALLSAIPIPVRRGKKERIILAGDVPSPANPPTGCPFHPRCPKCMEICRTMKPQLRKVAQREEHYVACHLSDTDNVPPYDETGAL